MSEIETTTTTLSPSTTVDINESLIRILLHPDHVDELGKMKPSAIPSDDLKGRGLSVDRQQYASKKYIEKNISDLTSRREGVNFSAFAVIKHDSVLSIQDASNREAFYVIADALDGNPAHALILLKNEYTRSEIKKLRKALIDEFKLFNKIEDVLI